jgi:hypothetical protein
MVGGFRTGAGRKKNPHKTKSITFHIQVEWELEIRKLIKDFKLKKNGV